MYTYIGINDLPGVQSSHVLSQIQQHESVKQHVNSSVFVLLLHLCTPKKQSVVNNSVMTNIGGTSYMYILNKHEHQTKKSVKGTNFRQVRGYPHSDSY